LPLPRRASLPEKSGLFQNGGGPFLNGEFTLENHGRSWKISNSMELAIFQVFMNISSGNN
jgi:hypothetical protein